MTHLARIHLQEYFMTSHLALATTFAFGQLNLGGNSSSGGAVGKATSFDLFDGGLFADAAVDSAHAPLFCSYYIISSAAPWLAQHGELATKIFRLLSTVPTFTFVNRIVAVPGRLTCADIVSLKSIRGLGTVILTDCIHSTSVATSLSQPEDEDTSRCLAALLQLPILHTLGLSSCDISDATATDILANLTSVTSLDLSGCTGIRPRGFVAMALMRRLKILDVSNFDFVVRDPQGFRDKDNTQTCLLALRQCVSLRHIDVSATGIRDSVIAHWAGVKERMDPTIHRLQQPRPQVSFWGALNTVTLTPANVAAQRQQPLPNFADNEALEKELRECSDYVARDEREAQEDIAAAQATRDERMALISIRARQCENLTPLTIQYLSRGFEYLNSIDVAHSPGFGARFHDRKDKFLDRCYRTRMANLKYLKFLQRVDFTSTGIEDDVLDDLSCMHFECLEETKRLAEERRRAELDRKRLKDERDKARNRARQVRGLLKDVEEGDFLDENGNYISDPPGFGIQLPPDPLAIRVVLEHHNSDDDFV